MSSLYNRSNYPEPPANLPPAVADYLRQLIGSLRNGEREIERAFNAPEPLARLDVLQALPDRYDEGDEGEFAAGVAGVSAGKYVYRGGVWVYVG